MPLCAQHGQGERVLAGQGCGIRRRVRCTHGFLILLPGAERRARGRDVPVAQSVRRGHCGAAAARGAGPGTLTGVAAGPGWPGVWPTPSSWQLDIEPAVLDLSSLASVGAFAADFLASNRSLDILLLNAGIMATPFGLTRDGIEQQFGVNHIGHHYLTTLLLPVRRAVCAAAGWRAIVCVCRPFILDTRVFLAPGCAFCSGCWRARRAALSACRRRRTKLRRVRRVQRHGRAGAVVSAHAPETGDA